MPQSLLTILKLCLLALLYLFFFRVVRAVWAEMQPRTTPPPPPPQAARPEAGGGRRGRAGGRLRVVEPPAARGRNYELGDELTMGRAPGCQVAVDDTFVSQLHARIFRRDGQLYLEDLGSTNGTYLNRKKVTGPVALRRGDRIQVGKTVLEVAK